MAVVWKEIAYKDDLDTHASQHAVSGSDSVFPADPDADRLLMWDNDPGELVWTSAGAGDVTASANIGDNAIVRGDGGAKGVQDSGVVISDTDVISGASAIVIDDAGTIGSASDTDAIAISAAGEVTLTGQPAFLAYVDTQQNNVTGDGTAYSCTGAFWTEVVDRGNNFADGTFTAPVTGFYHLSGYMFIEGIDASMARGNYVIITSNRTYLYSVDPASVAYDGTDNLMPISATVDMDANDTAYLYMLIDQGAKTVDLRVTYSIFSGALLC